MSTLPVTRCLNIALDGVLDALLDEDHPKTRVNDVLCQAAVVAPNRLDALAVHLVVRLGFAPIQALFEWYLYNHSESSQR